MLPAFISGRRARAVVVPSQGSRAVTWIILAGWLSIALAPSVSAQDEAGAVRPVSSRPAASVIVVGAPTNMYPYAYDEDGQLKGFALDVFDAVARKVGLAASRLPINSTLSGELLHDGRIDVILLWAETPERLETMMFSSPLLTLQTVVVVRTDETRIRTLADLVGRTIATGTPGSVASTYVRNEVRGATEMFGPDPEDVLLQVSNGRADAAVLSHLTAVSRIERLGLKNLRVLDERIEDYDVRYGFVVRRGEARLLARLNEGLLLIHHDGEFHRIYDRWFGRHGQRRFTPQEVAYFVSAALTLGLVVVTIALLRQRRLSRRISRQAAELLSERSLHSALFDNHPMATVVLERGDNGAGPRLVSANLEAARLCGLDLANVAGRELAALSLAPEISRYFSEIVERWPAGPAATVLEQVLRDSHTELETSLVPLAPAPDGHRRLCVLTADVTRRRLAEREIAHARRVRALGELVGGIAHEFNNLLTPVLMRAAMLRADLGDRPDAAESLRAIEDAARRSADLTRRLLAFGRRSDGPPGMVSVGPVLESCTAMLRPTFDRRIRWVIDMPADPPAVALDSTDLHQVLFNLVINARDTLVERLGRDGGSGAWTPTLELRVRALPPSAHLPRHLPRGASLAGWLSLTVADNGMGIAPENLDRIFEPFFTTKEVGQGTGLGLATVWHLVTEAGGVLDVDSRPGAGSRFIVNLPVLDRSPATAAPAPATPADGGTEAAPPPPRRVRRILLVEDEPPVAEAALHALRRLGHTVELAVDGAAALDLLRSGPGRYDALLVDINMPRMNGVDLIRQLRRLAWQGRLVVMTGRIADPDVRELERLRVDHVLLKPFDNATLAAALG